MPAISPQTAALDAAARSSGDLRPMAERIGRALFVTEWPAQVLNVYADGIAGHAVAGLRISGVHFHRPLTRAAFLDEIAGLANRVFAASPVEEVDIWATVPLPVRKGTVVSGALALPAWQTVFTVSVLRSEAPAALRARLQRGTGLFWDAAWERKGLLGANLK